MTKPFVYLLEDDAFLAAALVDEMSDLGCRAEHVSHECLHRLNRKRMPDLVIADLFLPIRTESSRQRNPRNVGEGIDALRRARELWPKARLVLLTGIASLDAQKWCDANDVTYLVKPIDRDTLARLLRQRKLRAFVVHGRNRVATKKAVAALKKSNIEPVVLIEQANRGRTVIEKFEGVADTCDAAIVVCSPDDFGGLAMGRAFGRSHARARQNVVFELGYFYGALRRRSGRVVVLEFGDTELPSDISGVVRIDASKTITKIASELRQEFRHLI